MPVSVLAGGGFETGRRQVAGAAWERVDTRFAAAEAGAHPTYVQALMAAEEQNTIDTEAFSVAWAVPHCR